MVFKLPVRPHVLKYLKANYPIPIVVNNKDHITNYLYLLMRRPLNDSKHYCHLRRYSEVLEIEVDYYEALDRGATNLTPSTVVKFNMFVDALIKEELKNYLNFIKEFNTGDWKSGIYDFMDKYGFLEGSDATYFNFQRFYYRYRKRMEHLAKE